MTRVYRVEKMEYLEQRLLELYKKDLRCTDAFLDTLIEYREVCLEIGKHDDEKKASNKLLGLLKLLGREK